MLWEMVAMVSAGFCFAGFALAVRKMFKRAPKWLVPAAAGFGMLVFQIYSEYTWFGHTKSLLPEGTVVVAEAEESIFYRPWSFVWPQVQRFIAADAANAKKVDDAGQIRQVQLYFFERRLSAYNLSVLVDCRQGIQAEVKGAAEPQWGKTPYTAKLAEAVCR
ncbi:MAG: hypothetical protein Q4D82_00570 [Neisseria sp.]|nr:hypothetical protein [Neisseria sp.]